PAHRAADDDGDHHRGDRPLGRLDAGARERPHRGPHPGGTPLRGRGGDRAPRRRRRWGPPRLRRDRPRAAPARRDAACPPAAPRPLAGRPLAAAAGVALLAGAVGWAPNGFLVTVVGLPSLAGPIGSLALFRGLAVGLLGTTAVTAFPKFWTDLAKARIGETPIPVVTLLFLALLIVFAILLHFTPFGRGVYSIGLSKSAAHFSGVNVERTKFILFALCGAVSALAGIYYTLRYGSARGDNATGLELQVVAAVLLGGVSIFGGRG